MSVTITPDKLRAAALAVMLLLSLVVSVMMVSRPKRVAGMPYGFVLTVLVCLIAGLTAAVVFSVRGGW